MMYINRQDFPKILPNKKILFCFNCKKPSPRQLEGERLRFYCDKCKKTTDRVLIFDPKMKYSFDKEGNYIHYGVGIFLINSEGKILLFLRRKYPFLYTIPAGHLLKGEPPRLAVIRETEEETNLKIKNPVLIFNGFVYGDECMGGADIHHWHLYAERVSAGSVKLDREGIRWQWTSPGEVDLDMVTYPVKFFLKNPDIIGRLSSM